MLRNFTDDKTMPGELDESLYSTKRYESGGPDPIFGGSAAPDRPPVHIDALYEVVTLTVMTTELNGLVLALPVGNSTIGRALTCDHCLLHPTVSRQHCVIHVSEHEIVIRDEGSAHGTRVNSQVIEHAYLKGQDLVQLGDVQLHLEIVPRASLTDNALIRFPKEHLKHLGYGDVGSAPAPFDGEGAHSASTRPVGDHEHTGGQETI